MIVAGFGFRAGATVESLADAYAHARDGLATSVGTTAIATVAEKAHHTAFVSLSHHLGARTVGIEKARLTAQTTITQSRIARSAHGTGSVAEAAALAAAGDGARLLGPRCISSDRLATCAIARGRRP